MLFGFVSKWARIEPILLLCGFFFFSSNFSLGFATRKTTILNNRERPAVGMLREILYPCFAALLLLLLVPIIPCKAAKRNHHLCTSSCGNIRNISYPFRLKDDPHGCGKRDYELSCENNLTILYSYSGKFRVEEINYEIFTIRVVDNFSSLPLHSPSFIKINLNFGSVFRFQLQSGNNTALNFIDCEAPINSSRYIDMAPCSKNTSSSFSLYSNQTYSYVVVGSMQLSDLEDTCMIDLDVSVSTRVQKMNNSSCSDIHDSLLYGTDLQWSSDCPPCGEILVL